MTPDEKIEMILALAHAGAELDTDEETVEMQTGVINEMRDLLLSAPKLTEQLEKLRAETENKSTNEIKNQLEVVTQALEKAAPRARPRTNRLVVMGWYSMIKKAKRLLSENPSSTKPKKRERKRKKVVPSSNPTMRLIQLVQGDIESKDIENE